MVMLHLELGRLKFYAVLGRYYNPFTNQWDRNVLRIAWIGRDGAPHVLRIGRRKWEPA